MSQYLSAFRIAAAGYLIIATAILLDLKLKSGMFKEIAWASLVSLAQLIGVAFVILVLLKLKLLYLDFALVLLFFLNGALIARKRCPSAYRDKGVFLPIFAGMLCVSAFVLVAYYTAGIMRLEANSLIPLSGIVAAAGMRTLSLAFDQWENITKNQQDIILGMLALGVSETRVFKYLVVEVIKHITKPIIDTLRAAGIVHIPGVMVGLLMAGILPIRAAAVQFVVLASMILIHMGVAGLTLFLIVKLHGLKLPVD